MLQTIAQQGNPGNPADILQPQLISVLYLNENKMIQIFIYFCYNSLQVASEKGGKSQWLWLSKR
jgi:hypothetical protein